MKMLKCTDRKVALLIRATAGQLSHAGRMTALLLVSVLAITSADAQNYEYNREALSTDNVVINADSDNDGPTDAIYFKIGSISNNAWMNSPQMVINRYRATSFVPLLVSRRGTGFYYGIGTELYQPDIAVNNGLAFQIGKSDTDKNTGKLRFVYKGDHSADNLLTLGFHTRDDILNVAASGKVGISTAEPFAKVDILGGGTSTDTGGEPMMAFQYNTGGYRHYIKTRHDGTGDGTSVTNTNAIDFYLNSGNSAGASSAPGTGNVHGMSVTAAGVGIGTTLPSSPLHISKSGTGTNYGIGTELYQPDIALNNGLAFQIGKSSTDKNTGKLRFVYKGDHSADNLLTLGFHTRDDILNVAATGKVGIGTSAPTSTLHVNGDVLVEHGVLTVKTGGADKAEIILATATEDAHHPGAGWIGTTSNHGLYIGTHNNATNIYLDTDDNVFVGFNGNYPETSNAASKFDLFVHQGILTEDYALAPQSSWSDYVFDKDYKLKKLEEVENYIQENKHLPNIPSKDEIAKEGYSLHEVNVKMLEKIEELTLYVIEQEKEIKAWKAQASHYSQQEERIKALEEKILNKSN